MNRPRSLSFTALRSIMIEGRLSVVTAIIKERIVPSCAPLKSSASATGMVPKISAYIGIPTNVARITPIGLLLPRTASTQLSGIQLWIIAPMPTPIRIYGKTFVKVAATCSFAKVRRSFFVRDGDSISTLPAVLINSST